MKVYRIISIRLRAFTALTVAMLMMALAPRQANAALPASDTACNDTGNGNQGGTGFATWITTIGSGGGVYTASATGAPLGSNGCSTYWGIYTGSGSVLTEDQRPFTNSGTLSVGQTITADMQNGGIQNGGSEGLTLWNTSNNLLWELHYSGGSNNWTIVDNSGNRQTTFPYVQENSPASAIRVFFTLTGATTYSVTAQAPVGGTSYGPYTGSLASPAGGTAISQLRFYTFDIGNNNNLQFNNLSVTCPDTLHITNSPPDDTNCLGSTASFTVSGISGDSVTYQWQKNGANIANGATGNGSTYAGVTTATLSITSVQSADAVTSGTGYRCVATDACGNIATSTNGLLIVNPLPAATITAPGSVCANSTGNSASVASGAAGYDWTITGGAFTGSTNGNSVTFTAGTASSLTLACTTTNSSGCTSNGTAVVTINALPSATISKTGSDCQGSTDGFSVPSGASSYSWTLTANTSGASISGGSTSSSVTVNNGSTGSYTINIAVLNSSGCSSNASLTITSVGAPMVSNPPSTSACQGSSATLTVSGSGVSAYQWMVNSGSGFVDVNGGANNGTDGTNGLTASFTTVTTTLAMNNYQYECAVTGCGGLMVTSAPATLTVSATTVGGTVTPASITICSGNSTSITNTGSTGSIQWQASGDDINFTNLLGATSSNYTTLALTSTTYFRAAVTNNPCSGTYSTTNTVTVNPTSVGGSATAAISNLLTGFSTTVTLSGSVGTIQWQASPDGVTFTNIPGATSATYTTPTLTQTTYYQAVVTSGVCSSSTSTVAEVTVGTGPSITSGPTSTAMCSGSPATLTVTATGASTTNYQWQQVGTGWGTGGWSVSGGHYIGNSTNNEAGGSTCSSLSSFQDINSPNGNAFGMYGGTSNSVAQRSFPALTAGQAVSVDFDNGNVDTAVQDGFALQTSSSNSVLKFYFLGGGTTYQYADNGTGAVVQRDTGIGFTRNGLRIQFILNTTNTYTLVVTPCGGSQHEYTGTYSNTISIIKLFNNNTSTGAAADLFFNNFIIGGYSDSANNYAGGNPGGWTNGADNGQQPISGATNASYTATPAATASYDVIVSDNLGVVESTNAIVTVNPIPSAVIYPPLGVCAGSSGNMASVTTNAGAAYAWTIANGTINSATNANPISFTAGASGTVALNCTVTTAAGCSSNAPEADVSITANTVIETNPVSVTVCQGSTATFAVAATGVTGYQWEDSTNGGATFNDLTGETNATYTTAATLATDNGTELVCQLAGCTGLTNTTVATLTVNPTPVGGTATPATSPICSGSSTTVTVTGSTGSIQWQQSPDGVSSWANVTSGSGGATAAYTTPGLTSTTYYRAQLTSGVCSLAYSTTATVTVNPPSVGGTVSPASITICSGGSTAITDTGYTGSVQWQASGDDVTFTNIPGATTSPYTTAALTNTTYYQAVVTSGACSSSTSSVATVTINYPVNITQQPTSTTNCAGSPVSLTVAASGTSPTYTWRKLGAGWGTGGWTFNPGGGGMFLGDSSHNGGNGSGATGQSGNINTSGQSWGLYNTSAGSVTEAIRTFPQALAVGQTFQIDMDNGYVTAGNGEGISLWNANSNAVWEFYFHGGNAYYTINDNNGPSTNSLIPYTDGGVRIILTLTDPTDYSVTIQTEPISGGGTFYGPFTGPLKSVTGGSVPAIIRLWDNNGTGGGAYDMFYNSIIINGTADDNAANYTSWTAGSDEGDAPLVASGDISGVNLSTLSFSSPVPGDSGSYDVVVASSPCGQQISSAATVQINPLPSLNTATNMRPNNLSLIIPITNLMANATIANSDTLVLSSVCCSTNGALVTNDATYVYYFNTNNVTDTFSYTVTDANTGCASTGTVLVEVVGGQTGQQSPQITVSGSSATTTFYGVPGYVYVVQRSTNLSVGAGWVPISTNTAPTNGVFSITDTFPDISNPPPGSAYYRLLVP